MTMEMSDNTTMVLGLNGIYNFRSPIICYQPSSITTNGMWQNQNPLEYSLPLFIFQLMIIVSTTQTLVIILKPLRQPRIVAEIIGGIILGPSGFGVFEWVGTHIFPLRSVMVLETMANIGILYYMFLVGVEMDISLVKQSISRQSLAMIIFGLCFPVIFFLGSEQILIVKANAGTNNPLELIYLGVIVSFTAFPVLSRILVELKLFNTELGRKAMSTALILDLCGWFLVTMLVGWVETRRSAWRVGQKLTMEFFYIPIFGSICFLLLCILVIRPTIIWIIERTPEGEHFNELHICLILTGVMICGFITDAIGTNSVFGAFVFGLIIPNGSLGSALLEKLEDFVTTLLLPLFFVIIGFRTNLYQSLAMKKGQYLEYLTILIILSTNGIKMLGTFLVSLYFDMPSREALTLGLLMNTKGTTELIVISVGLTNMVTTHYVFSNIILCIAVVTAITTPAVIVLYNNNRRFISYKHTTVQKIGMNAKLNIIMCCQTPRNVPAMINLLDASHATAQSPIHVSALHLVELTGRASAMLIVHNIAKSGTRHNVVNCPQTQSENVMKTFESYAKNKSNVVAEVFTTISPYATMHEDVCNIAEDKRIALIIVPFHKEQTVDGAMESINPALRQVNQNILANAPCSVAILINKGLGGSTGNILHRIMVIFIGGPNDREALAYGWRMSKHPDANLTVIRFVLGDDTNTEHVTKGPTHDNVITGMEKEAKLDDEYIGDFRLKTIDQQTIAYKEMVVKSVDEIVTSIRGLESVNDLYIVGRSQGIESTVTAGLNEFSENPELGAIGDLLVSSDFATIFSVLVVQQYVGDRTHGGGDNESPIESVNKVRLDIQR